MVLCLRPHNKKKKVEMLEKKNSYMILIHKENIIYSRKDLKKVL